MLSSITRNWWLVALRGALVAIFGVAAFVWLAGLEGGVEVGEIVPAGA